MAGPKFYIVNRSSGYPAYVVQLEIHKTVDVEYPGRLPWRHPCK